MEEKGKKSSIFEFPSWQQSLIVLVIVSALVFLLAVMLGDLGYVSNLYFYSTLGLLIIAVVPIILEIVSSGKIASRAIRKDENVSDVLKDKQKTFERRANLTYVFGISGIVTFLFSIITALTI